MQVFIQDFFFRGRRASDGKGVWREAPPGFFLNLGRSNIDLQPFLSFNLHNLAHLMRIAIECPELSSVNFEEVFEVFKEKINEFSYSIIYNYYWHLYFNFSYSDHMI